MRDLIERLEAAGDEPRYLPSGLPANYAAIHRDQLARAPLHLIRAKGNAIERGEHVDPHAPT